MVFSSTVFLFIFLPIVFGLYCILPNRHLRNGLLLIASLAFYAFGEPFVVFLMLLSIIWNYFFGLMMDKGKGMRRAGLIAAVVTNLGMLGVFKYAGFFVEILNRLPLVELPVPQIALPIGISFFTFQAMSYVIDVYRGDIPIQKNLFKLMLYVTCFPQLIAGPIVKYKDIESQLTERPMVLTEVSQGIRRFICGLAKKVLIADTVSVAADTIFAMDTDELILPLAWLAAICYTLQIYFDFSGYSDMAIGLGHMFGFTFKENFNYPYISASITEFWRRWHISVSTWFKEYLYIPLGGNRKGKGRTMLNKWIVFFFTGLWHGAAATFVVWGLMNGALMMLEAGGIIPVQKMQKHPLLRVLSHIYTLLAVICCFTIFRAESLSQGFYFLKTMFAGGGLSDAQTAVSMSLFWQQFSPLLLVTFGAAILFSMPIKDLLQKKISLCSQRIQLTTEAVSYVMSIVLFLLCLLYLSAGTYSPFIYLNF